MSNEGEKMSGHKHAENMALYAQDAAKTNEPWELWECKKRNDDNWGNIGTHHPVWLDDVEYRRKPVKWEPVGGKWWIKGDGNVLRALPTNDAKEFGTERSTQEQAMKAAIEMRKFNRLLALRDELCGDDEIDWGDKNPPKFYLTYKHDYKVWVVDHTYCNERGVHFPNRQQAERACDMLNSGEVVL
jgi:hypothetical protein